MLAHGWQTIPERGVVRSREPFKFVDTSHISGTADRLRRCYCRLTGECHKLLMVVGQLLITPTVEICIQQLGQVEEIV